MSKSNTDRDAAVKRAEEAETFTAVVKSNAEAYRSGEISLAKVFNEIDKIKDPVSALASERDAAIERELEVTEELAALGERFESLEAEAAAMRIELEKISLVEDGQYGYNEAIFAARELASRALHASEAGRELSDLISRLRAVIRAAPAPRSDGDAYDLAFSKLREGDLL